MTIKIKNKAMINEKNASVKSNPVNHDVSRFTEQDVYLFKGHFGLGSFSLSV